MISLGYMLKSEVIESQSMHSFKAYDKYLSKLLLILPRLFPHSLKKKAGGGGGGIKNSSLEELSGLHDIRYKTLWVTGKTNPQIQRGAE